MRPVLEPREGHGPEMVQCIAIARKSIADIQGHLALLEAVLSSCPNGSETSEEGEEWLSVAMALSAGKARAVTLVEGMAKSVADDVFCVVSNIYEKYPRAKAGDLREIAGKLLARAEYIEASTDS